MKAGGDDSGEPVIRLFQSPEIAFDPEKQTSEGSRDGNLQIRCMASSGSVIRQEQPVPLSCNGQTGCLASVQLTRHRRKGQDFSFVLQAGETQPAILCPGMKDLVNSG